MTDPKELALQLLSPSQGFEPMKISGLETLKIFNELEPFANQSHSPEAKLEAKTETKPASQGRIVPTVAIPAPKKSPAPRYSSNRPEYMPALKDQTVIEALLQVQRQLGTAPSTAAVSPAKSNPGSAPASKQEEEPSFQPAEIPYFEISANSSPKIFRPDNQ